MNNHNWKSSNACPRMSAASDINLHWILRVTDNIHSALNLYLLFLKTLAASLYFKFFIFYFLLLGPHLWHMDFPRLGVKLELQLPAIATATARAVEGGAASATYTTAHSNAGSLTH